MNAVSSAQYPVRISVMSILTQKAGRCMFRFLCEFLRGIPVRPMRPESPEEKNRACSRPCLQDPALCLACAGHPPIILESLEVPAG